VGLEKKIFLHCPELDTNAYPSQIPFDTSRAGRVRKILNSMSMLTGPDRAEVFPIAALREVLEKFHTPEYLDALGLINDGEFEIYMLDMGLGTTDCPAFRGVYGYSALAAGGTITGAEHIIQNRAHIAFNPSGGYHHAMPARASGFCYINDVVLGCMILAEAGKRVLYLDIDVHHGDGTQAAFYERSDVMTISFHQNPMTLFPGSGFENETGSGDGLGFAVNVPMPVGVYDEVYLKAFNEIGLPLIESFDPDVIVFELGADTLANDPIAGMQLTNNVYVDIIKSLLSFRKPILATGGGGYNIENTVRAWALAWSVLCGIDQSEDRNLGLGGVMIASTEWQGGLRDRHIAIEASEKQRIEPVVDSVIKKVKANIFKYHGL